MRRQRVDELHTVCRRVPIVPVVEAVGDVVTRGRVSSLQRLGDVHIACRCLGRQHVGVHVIAVVAFGVVCGDGGRVRQGCPSLHVVVDTHGKVQVAGAVGGNGASGPDHRAAGDHSRKAIAVAVRHIGEPDGQHVRDYDVRRVAVALVGVLDAIGDLCVGHHGPAGPVLGDVHITRVWDDAHRVGVDVVVKGRLRQEVADPNGVRQWTVSGGLVVNQDGDIEVTGVAGRDNRFAPDQGVPGEQCGESLAVVVRDIGSERGQHIGDAHIGSVHAACILIVDPVFHLVAGKGRTAVERLGDGQV